MRRRPRRLTRREKWPLHLGLFLLYVLIQLVASSTTRTPSEAKTSTESYTTEKIRTTSIGSNNLVADSSRKEDKNEADSNKAQVNGVKDEKTITTTKEPTTTTKLHKVGEQTSEQAKELAKDESKDEENEKKEAPPTKWSLDATTVSFFIRHS